uniref:WD repeat domain 46 n=1 Tax=Nothobranchius furzeri TaxID=105023 RepID=A0A8C6PPH1_NOTFU
MIINYCIAKLNKFLASQVKRPSVRYWNEPQKEDKSRDGENTGEAAVQQDRRAKKRKQKDETSAEKKLFSEKSDPFPGSAPIPKDRLQKFKRKDKITKPPRHYRKLKQVITRSEEASDLALKQAARFDLLLPEDAGFLEGDEDEDTCTISQEDIAEAVDITSGAKYFNLKLTQFGPYRVDYSKTGRQLLLGGRRGHLACFDWQTKQLMCEINVMESISDVKYSATSFLQYLDVSTGKEVAAICTKTGRLDVMCQNPHNAIIHLGHSNGTVTLWSPNQKEALVKMLCHQGGVRSVAVDKMGNYMVTSGMDKKLKVFDIRALKPLTSYFLPAGASCLSLSQRGLLSAATGDVVQVSQDVWSTPVTKPYMAHRVRGSVWGLQFCPFEDVLGVGHGEGFTSMLVPGAGEPNFDGLDANPYRSAKQRQEWEVKALLEKIQPELISLDPTDLGRVDRATFEQRHQEKVQSLGFDPHAKEKFVPKFKKKGRSSAGAVERRKKQVAHVDQRVSNPE